MSTLIKRTYFNHWQLSVSSAISYTFIVVSFLTLLKFTSVALDQSWIWAKMIPWKIFKFWVSGFESFVLQSRFFLIVDKNFYHWIQGKSKFYKTSKHQTLWGAWTIFRIKTMWSCVHANVTPCHALIFSKNFLNKYFVAKK